MQDSENEKLRRLLWLRHGCSISDLYGDDGEMQCSKCGIDFKRMSVEVIEQKFVDKNINKYSKYRKMVGQIDPIVANAIDSLFENEKMIISEEQQNLLLYGTKEVPKEIKEKGKS